MAKMSVEPPTQTTVATTAFKTVAKVREWHSHSQETAAGARHVSPADARCPWWLWPHLLGLDAPMVALAWQDWWNRAAGMPLTVFQRLILGLGVWMIYLADRLADTTRSLPGDFSTARHRFAGMRRGRLLALTVVIGAVLAALTVFTLPAGQFCGGLVLLATAGAYFWLIHRRDVQSWASRVPKEAVVGVIFATGTAFFVLCRPSMPTWQVAVAVGSFGVACFLNCALITSWERDVRDRRDPFSLLNAFPKLAARGLRPLCWFLTGIAATLGWATHTTIFLPVAMGALSLGMLDRWHARFSRDALRTLADAVLLTPWICSAMHAMVR